MVASLESVSEWLLLSQCDYNARTLPDCFRVNLSVARGYVARGQVFLFVSRQKERPDPELLPGTAAGGEGGDAIPSQAGGAFVPGDVTVQVCGILLPPGSSRINAARSGSFGMEGDCRAALAMTDHVSHREE